MSATRNTSTRINVIGASGSGASTVGRSLAASLAVPYFDSDDYYHAPSDPPFRNPRPADKRYAMLTRDLTATPSWVLAGGVVGWTPCPMLDFTCIVFLHVPTDVRMQRLRQRERERFGSRILEGGDMYESHEEFIQWASRYDPGDVDGKTLARHEAWLADQTCPVLRFDGVLAVPTITEQVVQFVGTP